MEKQIRKLVSNPEIGKPMRYNRKGTREVTLGISDYHMLILLKKAK